MSNQFRASRDVIIRTPHYEETIRYYQSVLQLPLLQQGASLTCFDAGAFRLYVEPGPRHGPVFDFLVADFAAARQSLINSGCVIVEDNPAVPRCYVADPHGLVFNLAQA